MQISSQEVHKIRTTADRVSRQAQERPVESVEELAARHGVKMDDVRRHTDRLLMAEEDVARERRVQDLARRIAAGAYGVEAEDVLDMAERRAIADRSGEL